MSEPRIGGLFFGYGGLDMAVQSVLGGSLAWVSEIDKGACKVIAHRFPNVPNHGDITKIDWLQVEPVDVITGGTPCQDLSHAGKRAGMTEGTRSNLWVAMREAIAQLRPSIVVWENVRGAFSASADSAVEPCPGCVGDGSGVHLRALGRVLGDLSDLGYDASWHGLRAADIGAPHGRFRVFVVATDAQRGGRDGWTSVAGRGEIGRTAAQGSGQGALLPTPRTSDRTGAGLHGEGGLDLSTAVTFLPTPQARDFKGYGPADANRHDPNLSAIPLLLPTPMANEAEKAGQNPRRSDGQQYLTHVIHALLPTPTTEPQTANGHARNLGAEVKPDRWGQYADAVHRWESLTRPAPAPTDLGPKGSPRLSAAFSEWMMGLPAGWVTDVPGITRNEALKALGNGVVPQQAAAALLEMSAREVAS